MASGATSAHFLRFFGFWGLPDTPGATFGARGRYGQVSANFGLRGFPGTLYNDVWLPGAIRVVLGKFVSGGPRKLPGTIFRPRASAIFRG